MEKKVKKVPMAEPEIKVAEPMRIMSENEKHARALNLKRKKAQKSYLKSKKARKVARKSKKRNRKKK